MEIQDRLKKLTKYINKMSEHFDYNVDSHYEFYFDSDVRYLTLNVIDGRYEKIIPKLTEGLKGFGMHYRGKRGIAARLCIQHTWWATMESRPV